MFLSDIYKNKNIFENISPIDLAEVLFRSLQQKYPEAITRYGHEVIGDAVIDYAEEADDIHSMSDVDMAVDEILEYLENYQGDRTNDLEPDSSAPVTENLRKWFKEKWVRFGPDGKIRGACARGDSSEGKPKCLPQAKAHALGKKGRKYAAAKKRREDPNPERSGAAINVATKKKSNEGVAEGMHSPGATQYSGKPDAYTFSKVQQKNYDMLSSILARNGMKFTHIDAVTYPGERAYNAPNRNDPKPFFLTSFIVKSPALEWIKYEGGTAGGGQNLVKINSKKMKLTEFLSLPPKQQDALLQGQQGVAEYSTAPRKEPVEDFDGLQFKIISYPHNNQLRVGAYAPGSSKEIAHVLFDILDYRQIEPLDLHVDEIGRAHV